MKTWLFDVRESGAKVGKLALEQMGTRIKKWRMRREKEGGVRLARVGGALEMVHNERVECEWHFDLQFQMILAKHSKEIDEQSTRSTMRRYR